MSKEAEYRGFAAQCLEIARKTSVADNMRLIAMAEAWLDLAERISRWQHVSDGVEHPLVAKVLGADSEAQTP